MGAAQIVAARLKQRRMKKEFLEEAPSVLDLIEDLDRLQKETGKELHLKFDELDEPLPTNDTLSIAEWLLSPLQAEPKEPPLLEQVPSLKEPISLEQVPQNEWWVVGYEDGCWWGKHLQTFEWAYYDGTAWVRGTPPDWLRIAFSGM